MNRVKYYLASFLLILGLTAHAEDESQAIPQDSVKNLSCVVKITGVGDSGEVENSAFWMTHHREPFEIVKDDLHYEAEFNSYRDAYTYEGVKPNGLPYKVVVAIFNDGERLQIRTLTDQQSKSPSGVFRLLTDGIEPYSRLSSYWLLNPNLEDLTSLYNPISGRDGVEIHCIRLY